MPNVALMAQAEILKKQQNIDLNSARILAALIIAGVVAQNALFAALTEAQKKQGQVLLAKQSNEDLGPTQGAIYRESVQEEKKPEEKSLDEKLSQFLINFSNEVKAVLEEHNAAVDKMIDDLEEEGVKVFSSDTSIRDYQRAVMVDDAPTVLNYQQDLDVTMMTQMANLGAPKAAEPPANDDIMSAIHDLKGHVLSQYLKGLVLNDEFKMDSRMVERYMSILDTTEANLEARVTQKLQLQVGDNYVHTPVLRQYDNSKAAQKVGMPTTGMPTVSPTFGGKRHEEEELGYTAPRAPNQPHKPAGGRSGHGAG